MSGTGKNKCRSVPMRCGEDHSLPVAHHGFQDPAAPARTSMIFLSGPSPTRHARCDQQDQLVTPMHLPLPFPCIIYTKSFIPCCSFSFKELSLIVYDLSPSFRYSFPHHLSSGKCFIRSFIHLLRFNECLLHARHQVLSIHV